MKKFILAFLLVFLSLFSLPETAKAESETKYSRILSETVTLYMDADLAKPWFTLPYSYYLKVLTVGARSVKVEYMGGGAKPSVKGYIPIEDFSAEDEPAAPYPAVTFSIGASCLLYKDTNFSYAETIAENSDIDFYGEAVGKNGKEYVFGFVSAASGDNYMGFIEKSVIKNFAVPRLPVEVLAPESEGFSETKAEETPVKSNALGDNLQIVIIVGISVVAISIVYLLFRPAPQRAREEALTEEFKDG